MTKKGREERLRREGGNSTRQRKRKRRLRPITINVGDFMY